MTKTEKVALGIAVTSPLLICASFLCYTIIRPVIGIIPPPNNGAFDVATPGINLALLVIVGVAFMIAGRRNGSAK